MTFAYLQGTMMTPNTLVLATLSICAAFTSHSMAEEIEFAKPVLQVIRLKPGEHRFLEVALPHGEFRPTGKSGRSDFGVQFFPERADGDYIPIVQGKPVQSEFWKSAPYPIAEGVTLRWSEDKPGIEFQAAADPQPVTKDIRVTYANFGFEGTHAVGFRVIVMSEK